MLNSYGGDVVMTSNDGFWVYIGKLTNDSIKHCNYYKYKLALKIRILFKRKNLKWDGYYYFALTDKQYEEYLAQKNKRGRPKKYYTFDTLFMYKLLDECILKNAGKKYIFRVKSDIFFTYTVYKKNFKVENPELIEVRDSALKFKDILITERNYRALWAKK